MQAIVSDFGFARTIGENDDAGQTTSNVGPIKWMAPESLSSRVYSEKSDVWSFGITGILIYPSIHLSLFIIDNSSIDDILLTICYIIIITLFGIVTTSIAWEVIARECPYGDMSPALAAHAILSGQLLAIPDHCPPRLGEIMLSCWQVNPQDRPSFYQIYEQLESLKA